MKDVVLILMALVIVGGGYFLKIKSDEAETLTVDLRKKDQTLSQLQQRLKTLDEKVAKDEATLAVEQKQLAGQAQQVQLQASRLNQDLNAAQAALAEALAHKQSLKDQEAALGASKQSGATLALSGHIQSDQTRLKEVERQMRVIDESEKKRKTTEQAEAKIYHQQVKTQELSIEQQIKESNSQSKILQGQLRAKQREKINLNRDQEAGEIQKQIDAVQGTVFQLSQSLQALRQKELADSQSNGAQQQKALTYATDTKASLSAERTQLQADLANLTSRNDLAKRDGAETAAQMATLRSQEHESDIKIQSLNQIIQRLKAEIAALPHSG